MQILTIKDIINNLKLYKDY